MDYLLGVTDRKRRNVLKLSRGFKQKTTIIAQRKYKCSFCNRVDAAYTCQQCDKHYCSSECFSTESHRECSEYFFKKCVFEHLKSRRIDSEEREKFTEILKRNSNQGPDVLDLLNTLEQDDADEDEISSDLDIEVMKDKELLQFSEELVEKLNGMNIENDQELDFLWNNLSSEEKERFIKLVDSNSKLFDKVIVDWTPWWRDDKWNCLVEDITTSSSENEKPDHEHKFPILYTEIEHLNKLTSKTPSPSLIYSVICVSFAYAHLVRHFNGEIVVTSESGTENNIENNAHIWSVDIYNILMKFAPILSNDSKIIFNNCDKTIRFCVNQALSSNEVIKNEDKILLIELLDDVQMFFNKKNKNIIKIEDNNGKTKSLPKNLIYLLSDLIHILQNILKFDKKINKKISKNIELVRKKLIFYLSWIFDYGEDILGEILDKLSNSIKVVCEQIKQEIALFEHEQFIEIVP